MCLRTPEKVCSSSYAERDCEDSVLAVVVRRTTTTPAITPADLLQTRDMVPGQGDLSVITARGEGRELREGGTCVGLLTHLLEDHAKIEQRSRVAGSEEQ